MFVSWPATGKAFRQSVCVALWRPPWALAHGLRRVAMAGLTRLCHGQPLLPVLGPEISQTAVRLAAGEVETDPIRPYRHIRRRRELVNPNDHTGRRYPARRQFLSRVDGVHSDLRGFHGSPADQMKDPSAMNETPAYRQGSKPSRKARCCAAALSASGLGAARSGPEIRPQKPGASTRMWRGLRNAHVP